MLEFDATAHRYTLDGRHVPSVTQVLERYAGFENVPPARLLLAARFGRTVHEACNLLVRDELDWSSLDEEVERYVRQAERFLAESGFVVLDSELRMASKSLQVAGTLDLRGLLLDKPTIIDWKSCISAPRSVGLQTAGYEYLYREQFKCRHKHKRACLLLQPDSYKLVRLPDPGDWNLFLSALNLHHWYTKKAA